MRTDRQDEANSRFSQICELAKRREVCVCVYVCVCVRAHASRCFRAGNMYISDKDYRITHQVAVCIPGADKSLARPGRQQGAPVYSVMGRGMD